MTKTKSIYSTITHRDDLDGHISMLYAYSKKGQENIGGLSFDNCKIWVSSTPTETTIWLDLGVIREGYKAIDHHITHERKGMENPHHNSKIYNGDIRTKFPLGNILWMMYLSNEELENYNTKQLKLLLSADATYNNFLKFEENTLRWLEEMGMNILVDLLKRTPKSEFEKVHRGYDFKMNYVENHNLFVDEYGTPAQDRLDELIDLMKWDRLELPNVNYVYDLRVDNGRRALWNEDTLTYAKMNNRWEVRADIIGFREK